MLNGGLGLGMIFYAQDLASDVMARLERRFKTLDSASEEVTRDLSDRFARMKMGLASMAAGGAVLGTLGAVSLAAGRAAAQMEMYTVALDTMLRQQGAALSATQFLEDLRQFAKATPFEFTDLVEASKQLMAFGFRAEQVLPMMRAIGDAVAALGGGAEAQRRVIWALGQMQAKGRVLAEELMQLQEVGVPVFQILQEELGLTADQVARIGELGISAQQGIQAILAGMTKRFGGMMAVQSRTVMGILSNIRDAFQGILLDIGGTAETGFLAGLRGILEDIRDFLSDLDDRNVFRGLGEGLASLVRLLRPLIGGVMSIGRGFALLFERRPELLTFATALAGVASAVLFLVGSVAVLRSGLAIAGRMAAWFGISAATGLGPLLWWVTAITAAILLLQQAYQRNWFGLRDFIDKARLAWQGWWSLVSTARFDGKQLVGSMPVEVRDALQRAGLLEFVLTAFMVFTRLRAFLHGVSQGFRDFAAGVQQFGRMVLPPIERAAGAVMWLLRLLGLASGRAAAAPPSTGWQAFGRWVGRVVGLLAGLVGIALAGGYAVGALGSAVAVAAKVLAPLGQLLLGVGRLALVASKALLTLGAAAVRAGLALMTTPYGWAIAGLAALGSAVYLLVTHWDAVRAAAGRAWAWLSGFVQQMPGWAQVLLAALLPVAGIPLLLARNWSQVAAVFQRIPGLVAGAMAMLPQLLRTVGQALVQGAINIGRSIITGLVQGLRSVAGTVLGSLGPIGQALASMLGMSAAAPKPGGVPAGPAGLVPAAAAAGTAVAMPVPGFPLVPPVAFPQTQAQTAARVAQAVQQARQAPAPAAQPRGVTVRQPVQLVLDGRVLAQTMLEIQDEDERRAGKW